MTASDSTPTFSVVIPSYNRASLVCRAVRSAIAQTHPPGEIIVVDDGSTDDTEERLHEFASQIRYVRQDRGGPARARNRGVECAGNRWIAFLDSDDLWEAHYLAAMSRAIAATDGKAGFYFADALIAGTDPPMSLWGQSGFKASGSETLFDDGCALVVREVQPMLLQFSVFDRERYRALGGLREDLMTAEDTHLFLRLGLGGGICAVNMVAGTLMNDESPSKRLTGVFDTRAIGRWENTVLMFQDVLSGHRHIAGPHRRLLRRYLAEAHWRLARLESSRGRYRVAVGHTLRALTIWPGLALTIVQRNLRSAPA